MVCEHIFVRNGKLRKYNFKYINRNNILCFWLNESTCFDNSDKFTKRLEIKNLNIMYILKTKYFQNDFGVKALCIL